MKRILIVDDEESMRTTLSMMLVQEGFVVDAAEHGIEALERCGTTDYDLVITDLKMPRMDGIGLIEALTGRNIPIIVMTAFATKEEAIRALNHGATFFIEKPFKKPDLMQFVARSLQLEELTRENRRLKAEREKTAGLDAIIGTSPGILAVKELIRKVAPTESNVLLSGESGTGKEIAARALHQLSHRADGPFVAINCGAIPQELLESELFGHVKGSFTGAIKDKTGLMEEANGGTFFLDEVGNTNPSIQMKILRALQEREVMPVGGQTARKVDIRILAATNEDLTEAIARDSFRKDLFYRLNVINIHIPPLRERREDIEMLFLHFLRQKGANTGSAHATISHDLIDILIRYDWPGNIRELENVVERLIALSAGSSIGIDMLPDHIRAPKELRLVSDDTAPHSIPCMDDIEKAYIHWVLSQCGGHKQKAAEILGIGRSTLDRKIERYELS